MKFTYDCECCGHKLVAYTHKLNKMMVSSLEQLVEFYDQNHRRANLQKDLHLTKNQYANFQKLQYFELVHRDSNGWLPTQKGSDFIAGKVWVPNTVGTLGKKILEPDHPAWETHQRRIDWVKVGDYIPTTYKQREEYQDEKSLTLF
jgi:hypothetical protein